MKEEISNLIYDFAYTSVNGGTSVNSDAVYELTDKIIKIVSDSFHDLIADNYNKGVYHGGKCKNCQILKMGSIIKVDENGKCTFCNRKVGLNY